MGVFSGLEIIWKSSGNLSLRNRKLEGNGKAVCRQIPPTPQHADSNVGYGTTNVGYGTTYADAGVGIALKRGIQKFNKKSN